MSTQREREEKRRQEKLAQMQEQIEGGSLTVRQMTDEERKAYAPRPRPAGKAKPKRRG